MNRTAIDTIVSPFTGSFAASPIQHYRSKTTRQNSKTKHQVTPDQINSSPDRSRKRSPTSTPSSNKKKLHKSSSSSPGNFPMPPHSPYQHYYFGHHPQFMPYQFMAPVPVFATQSYPNGNMNAAREMKSPPPNSIATNQHQEQRPPESSPTSQGLTSSVESDNDDLPFISPYEPSPIEEAQIMMEFESCWLDPIPLQADEKSAQVCQAIICCF